MSAAAGFADPPLCCLNAEILVRFLCSGKPVGVVFNLGAEGAVVGRSLMSPMKAEGTDGTETGGSIELDSRSSSSSEKSTVKRCPLRSMVDVCCVWRSRKKLTLKFGNFTLARTTGVINSGGSLTGLAAALHCSLGPEIYFFRPRLDSMRREGTIFRHVLYLEKDLHVLN